MFVLFEIGMSETLSMTEIYAINGAIMLVIALPLIFIVRDVQIYTDSSASQD